MSLEKIEVVDLIEVTANACVQVRTKTVIKEDGIEISSKFHRHVVVPGDSYAGEDAKVQAVCKAAHTATAIAAYKAEQIRVAQAQESVA
jgi:hypothetical protein